MGQLRTANKRHNRAIRAKLLAAAKPQDPAPAADSQAAA